MYDGFYSSLKTKKTSLHTLESYTFIGGKLLGLLFLGFGLYFFRGAQWRTMRTMMTPKWTRRIFVFIYHNFEGVLYLYRLYTVYVLFTHCTSSERITTITQICQLVWQYRNWIWKVHLGWLFGRFSLGTVFGFPMPPKFSNGRSWTWLLFVYITTKLRSCKRL